MEVHEPQNPEALNHFEQQHVPKIEVDFVGEIIRVRVEIDNPMQPVHYLDWIELYVDDEAYDKVEFEPEDQAIAEFDVAKDAKSLKAISNCHLHGAWQTKLTL